MESSHDNIGPVSCLVKTNGNVLDLRIVGVSISQEIGRIPVALLELLDGTPAEGELKRAIANGLIRGKTWKSCWDRSELRNWYSVG